MREFGLALRIVSAAAFLILVVFLFYLGSQPVAVELLPAPYDKLAHFIVFFVLTLTAGVAGLYRFPLLLLVLGMLLGAADELHQLFLPGRQPGWDDWLADCAAILIAVIVVPMLFPSTSAIHERRAAQA